MVCTVISTALVEAFAFSNPESGFSVYCIPASAIQCRFQDHLRRGQCGDRFHQQNPKKIENDPSEIIIMAYDIALFANFFLTPSEDTPQDSESFYRAIT